jgi:hypothetical protein
VYNPVIFNGKIVFSDSGDQICDGSGRLPKRLNKNYVMANTVEKSTVLKESAKIPGRIFQRSQWKEMGK